MYEIEFDPAKREAALETHKVDFSDATEVFSGQTIDILDLRRSYGEARTITIGRLHGRMVVVVWTERGRARRIISMRKANEREQRRYSHGLGEV